MPISVISVAHGAAAFDALAQAVARLKGSDPLAPVTVVVPTNTAGVMARRAIGRRGGAAAIDVLTLYRVAELLGAPDLVAAGRKPVSTPVVDLAVKQILRASPGLYREVAEHPSTVVALRDLFREVRLAGREVFTSLGRTKRGGEPARVITELARTLAPGWYDEGDLLEGAAARARREPPGRFGRVVVHLAERVRPAELDLLRALGEMGELELLVGVTGDAHADESVHAIVTSLTGAEAGPPAVAHRVTDDLRVMSTTDADDEVRLAVRAVLDAARAGTAFDRMAILWPTDRPYARLVEHHLSAASLPWNGRPGTGVAERRVPRVIAELLDIDRRGLRRTTLMTLLGDVPARGPDGRIVPVAHWERIGRRAGILREEDWHQLLPDWIDAARDAEGAAHDVGAATSLLAFVDELRAVLGDPRAVRPWREWVTWTGQQLERWFGAGGLDRLDGHERVAWEQTQRVLDRLGHLDALGGPVTRAEFRATFVAELDTAPARQGTVGDGVHIGSLSGSNGLDVDLTVVIGAADGLLPPPPAIDPLLGDDDRRQAGLVTSDERVRLAHRRFLAAVASSRVVVTIPRGDLRATAAHQPSRWVVAPLADAGRVATEIASHAQALAVTEFPVSPSEHRLRELWTAVRAGVDVREHAVTGDDRVLAAALRLRDARASSALTIYDGDLSSRTIRLTERLVSPTQIEQWPTCPHAYFLRHVLGVYPVDEPGEIVSVTPLDRGSAIHEALDRLHRLVLAGDLPAPADDGWGVEHHTTLARIADAVADDLQRAGRTGRAAYWSSERRHLVDELQDWMRSDAARWDGRRIRWSEARFGVDQPVTLSLPDGRTLAFRGSIDRIDELADGTFVVTDHKSGKPDDYLGLEDDPTNGGTHFQLPVYAAAARVLLGRPDAVVHAEYAFLRRGNFRRIGVTLDDPTWVQVTAALGQVVDGIESGLFPAIPERPGWRLFVRCRYCDPDGLGTTERWPEWERKRHDTRLQPRFGEAGAIR